MRYKKGLIFICLLIFLFAMASVVAADVNETVVAIDNQNSDLIEICLHRRADHHVGFLKDGWNILQFIQTIK